MYQAIRVALAGAAFVAAMAPATSFATTLTTLYTFTGGKDGAYPFGGLVNGANGALYGTAMLGGGGSCSGGCGTVFQLTPSGSSWKFSVIYTFQGDLDGQQPINLTPGANGALFGVAQFGGYSGCYDFGVLLGCGQVFELQPPGTGQTKWTFTTLHEFTGAADGAFPAYGVSLDSAGDVYGFALSGGTCPGATCGTAFKLTPKGKNWQFKVLHEFRGGSDGAAPYGSPMLDAAGNVYGTTSTAGRPEAICTPDSGCGTVFRLAPPAAGKKAWSKTTLWSFSGTDGAFLMGSLLVGSSGAILGTANLGGDTAVCAATSSTPAGCGTVWQLTPPAAGKSKWTRSVLWQFQAGSDGLDPTAGPTPYNGDLYVTGSGNGTQGFGSIVKMVPPQAGKKDWTTTSLYDFANGADGAQPTSSLLVHGTLLYGTTMGADGGPAGYGTVFSVTP